MTEQLVRWTVSDGVATVTLDSARNRNALSRQLLTDLTTALDAVINDPACRVIVLTGEGPAFCAGADLKEQRIARQENQASPLDALPLVIAKIWTCPQPVICRLNGPARAGGVGLMAACDLVVAPDTVTFSFTEVHLGLVPAVISVPVLRRGAAAHAIHRLFLTAEVFGAAKAEAIGLVDEVTPLAELDATTEMLVAALLRGAPEALALTKRLSGGDVSESEAALESLRQLSTERFASAEGQEGMRSFAEKTDPEWVPAKYRR